MVTAYDWWSGSLADSAGVDCVLVGDSLAMVVAGRETTLSATIEQMIYHGEIVSRAVQRAIVFVDLPFPLQHLGVGKAIESAARILQETGCQAIKLEGTSGQQDVIAGIVEAGIPVMAHVGLRPGSTSTRRISNPKRQRTTSRRCGSGRSSRCMRCCT